MSRCRKDPRFFFDVYFFLPLLADPFRQRLTGHPWPRVSIPAYPVLILAHLSPPQIQLIIHRTRQSWRIRHPTQRRPQRRHRRPPRPMPITVNPPGLELLPPCAELLILRAIQLPHLHQPCPVRVKLAIPLRPTQHSAGIHPRPPPTRLHRRIAAHAPTATDSTGTLNVPRPSIRASRSATSGGQGSPCTDAAGNG